jgi:hypothetical protein
MVQTIIARTTARILVLRVGGILGAKLSSSNTNVLEYEAGAFGVV